MYIGGIFDMKVEQLRQIAIRHAKYVRTRCKFIEIADHFERIENTYIFYALYKCKRTMQVKQIIITHTGRLVAIKND